MIARKTSCLEDRDFLRFLADEVEVLNVDMHQILQYVCDNFTPGDVFGDDQVKVWAGEEFNPEDIFTANALTVWALDNGFIEEE